MVVDFHLRGVDVVEVWWTEQAIAKALLHVVVTTAIISDQCTDFQLLVLVFCAGDGGDGGAEFRASDKHHHCAKT